MRTESHKTLVTQVAFLQFNRDYYPGDQSNEQLKIQLKQHLESILILEDTGHI